MFLLLDKINYKVSLIKVKELSNNLFPLECRPFVEKRVFHTGQMWCRVFSKHLLRYILKMIGSIFYKVWRISTKNYIFVSRCTVFFGVITMLRMQLLCPWKLCFMLFLQYSTYMHVSFLHKTCYYSSILLTTEM